MGFYFDESWERRWYRFLDKINGREVIEDSEFEEFDAEGETVYVGGENLPLVDTFKTWQEEGNLPLPMLLELMVMAYCRDLGFGENEVLLWVLNNELFEKAISRLNQREMLFFQDILSFSEKVLQCGSMEEFKDLVRNQVFFLPREREVLISGMAEDLMPSYLTSLPFWEKVHRALLPERYWGQESPLYGNVRVTEIELKKYYWTFVLPEVELAYLGWLQGEPFRLPRIHDRVIQALSLEGAVFKLGSREVSPQLFTRVWVLSQTLGKVLGLEAKGPFLSLKGLKQSIEKFMGDEESPVLPARLKSALVSYLKGIGQDPLRYANILNILK